MTTDQIMTDDAGLAIRGYDPVAYFTEGRPLQGRAAHSVEWGGATWLFASRANADRFAAEPDRYSPRFGGHCAFGASVGQVAEASPLAWRIIDGRLCLMRSAAVRALSRLFTGRIVRAMER